MENQAFSELRLPSKKSERAVWEERSLQVPEHMSQDLLIFLNWYFRLQTVISVRN